MNLFNILLRRIRINRTVRELSVLDSHMLDDIGIDRGNITEIVNKMVDTKTNESIEHIRYDNVATDDFMPGAAAV